MRLAAVSLALALVTVGCSPGADGPPIETVPPTSVTVVVPSRRDVARTLQLVGQVRAYQEASLRAKLAGYVRSVEVEPGDGVAVDQLLATVELPEVEQQVLEAQARESQEEQLGLAYEDEAAGLAARAQAARTALERLEARQGASLASADELAQEVALQRQAHQRLEQVARGDEGLVAQQELDQSRGRLRQAESRLEAARQEAQATRAERREAQRNLQAATAMAQAQKARSRAQQSAAEARSRQAEQSRQMCAYSQIRAPFAGTVTRRWVDPGALAGEQPLLTLADLSRVRIELAIPETEAPHVRAGITRVTLSGPALKSTRQTITRSTDSLDVATRTLPVEIELSNPGHRLSPGMAVDASVELERRSDVLALPVEAVLRERKGPAVFIVESGKAKKLSVRTGFQGPEWVEILEGLSGQEQVVVRGNQSLKNGAAVEIQSTVP